MPTRHRCPCRREIRALRRELEELRAAVASDLGAVAGLAKKLTDASRGRRLEGAA